MINTMISILTDSYLVVVPLVVVYLIYRKNKNVYALLLALLLTLVIVTAMKVYISEPRPCVESLAECEDPFESFPSRHAAIVSTVLVFLLFEVPLFIAYLVYVLLVAFSRIYLGVHYPQDVVVGALIGLAVGILCLKASKRLGLQRRVV